jgi:hypothetical protein
MPAKSADLDTFRDDISQRVFDKRQSHQEVLTWLATERVYISRRTLVRRLAEWKVTWVPDQAVVDRIHQLYHTTRSSDAEIARSLSAEGINISHWQVERIRWAHGWRRRATNDEQRLTQRVETFRQVEKALGEGAVRNYGRGHFDAFLRSQEQYPAREDDVRDAIKALDPQGTEARRFGLRKRRPRGQYITSGPNWLWSIDGHDKFRPFGIYIYGAVDAFSWRIIWLTVSNNNRLGVVILKQIKTNTFFNIFEVTKPTV